jgi:hypothetical protein
MPTVSEVVGGLLENAIQNPRTTVSSILTALIGGVPILLGTGLIHGKAATIAGSILLTSKIIWGTFFQKDAGRTPAYVPGIGVQNVPSHEIPDNPAAVPVTKPPEVPKP